MRTDRRKIIRHCILPASYERLNYIENTSTAYIDTGVMLHEDLSFKGAFAITDNTIVNSYEAVLDSNIKAINISCYSISFLPSKKLIAKALNKITFINIENFNISSRSKHYYELGKGFVVFDGLKYTKEFDNFTQNNVTIKYLLQGYNNSYLRCRLYENKIYQNGVLIRYFIPAKNMYNNKIGMYDFVEKKFYTSPNGVAFTGG